MADGILSGPEASLGGPATSLCPDTLIDTLKARRGFAKQAVETVDAGSCRENGAAVAPVGGKREDKESRFSCVTKLPLRPGCHASG